MDKANPPPPPVSHKSDSTPQGGKTGQRVRSTRGQGWTDRGKKDRKREPRAEEESGVKDRELYKCTTL